MLDIPPRTLKPGVVVLLPHRMWGVVVAITSDDVDDSNLDAVHVDAVDGDRVEGIGSWRRADCVVDDSEELRERAIRLGLRGIQ